MSTCSTASPAPPDVSNRLISMKDLADELHVCERTIRRCIQKGQLPPPIQIGGRKYWVASVLDARLRQKQESAIKMAMEERRDEDRRRARLGLVDGGRN